MSEKKWVDDNHYRTVSEDGTKSWLFEVSDSLFTPDPCIEVAHHNSDGTTDAWDYDSSFLSSLFKDSRGEKKNDNE